MRKSFQTFITQGLGDEEMFSGLDENQDSVISELPINLFSPDVTEKEIEACLIFKSDEEKELFFQNNKLITVTMQIN